MNTNLVFILSIVVCALAASNSQNGVKNVLRGSKTNDGKVVVSQLCNTGTAMAEISATMKKELETMKKELTEQLSKQVKKQNKDPWIKLNTAPVCFGARGNQFGKFFVPSAGKLVSIKLVHLYGYVRCDKRSASYWSYWGCSIYHGLREKVNVVITTSSNSILLPASQFMRNSNKWSSILGYNSFSPEIVLSVFSNPPSVAKGQELRLWYGEDLMNSSEGDNDGIACADVFARFI